MTLPPESFDNATELPQGEAANEEAQGSEASPPDAIQQPGGSSSPTSLPGTEVDWEGGDHLSMTLPPDRPAEAPVSERLVEDMTVAELLGVFWASPAKTWQAFLEVVQTPRVSESRIALGLPSRGRSLVMPHRRTSVLSTEERAAQRHEALILAGRIVSVLIALYGSTLLATFRTEAFGLNIGAPFLLLAIFLWAAIDFYDAWSVRRRGGFAPEKVTQDETGARSNKVSSIGGRWDYSNTGVWGKRLILMGGGLAFSILTAVGTQGNVFRPEGVLAWVISVILWVAAVAPAGWGVRAFWNSVRRIRIRLNWTFWTMVVIVLVAAFFRLNDLRGTPIEMTSDHVEKLLDSQRILDGNPQVFFPNNGGREPMQFYTMALFSRLPGLGMNFFTLKLLTVIEGLISIPILWWMGREMIGDDEPELGNIVGLVLAGLVAVSYWHTMLSRLGLRIVLTVSFTALLIIYLSRGLRKNQRGDFIKAGLILGLGMYAYQAVRMLPVVVLLGVGLAIILGWFKQREERQTGLYLRNLAVLVLMALVVFVPLLEFSIEDPQSFWRRTSGRLLGEDLIETTNEKGEIVQRQATLEERMAAFQFNLPILLSNIRNALLMYNWKGDVAWITAAPNEPQMDVYTGTLLVVGLGAWLARMVRRRDAAAWLMPPMLFIMLLPSALSIAYPIENPSATRTSGTLPEAYLFAALPLALIIVSARRAFPGRGGLAVGVIGAGLLLVGAWSANWNTYFGEYHTTYLLSSPAPYSEAGQILRGFAESTGSSGNAFVIGYPFWWDHRAVGIEAGYMDWPNGIPDPDGDHHGRLAVDTVPNFLYLASQRTGAYRFDPEKDVLFFYSIHDEETGAKLQALFPTGYGRRIQSYKLGDDYMIFQVPRLGAQGFIDFAVRTGAAG